VRVGPKKCRFDYDALAILLSRDKSSSNNRDVHAQNNHLLTTRCLSLTPSCYCRWYHSQRTAQALILDSDKDSSQPWNSRFLLVPALRSYAPLLPQLLKGPISLQSLSNDMSHFGNMAAPHPVSPRTATPNSGSRTMEVRPQPVLRLSAPSGVLRLRAEPSERRHIQWAEDVVDNEGMGKKSSKGTNPIRAAVIYEVLINLKSVASITNPAPLTSLPTTPPQTPLQIQIPTPSPTTAPQGPREELVVRAADGHISTPMTIARTSTIMVRALVPRKSISVNGGSQARMLMRRCRSRRSEV
jgi:hypothetical protein